MTLMRFFLVGFVALYWLAGHAAADATRGARIFGQCMACHSIKPGENMTGPSLAGVWNHKAAVVPSFQRYSDALKKSKLVWTDDTLDKWLRDPAALVPGTTMTYPGLKEAQARQDVIAYLKAASDGRAPQPQMGGGGMMAMQRAKPDLKQAPPEGQVTSLKHCGDTYAVATADGKNQKIWEFNLRFKTDTGKLGPKPGTPVAVGAGMQGDRASIVFASPAEIGKFIQESCPL
jgi:cytochrome c